MLGMIDEFIPIFEQHGIELSAPKVVQTLSVSELIKLVPEHDGWIIGDDPATKEVFQAGKAGRLKAAVKWGIGVDNVDFDACNDLQIPIINTPDMFGAEVADIAMGYVIALARHTYEIDRSVRDNQWIKPKGISLSGKIVALVGFGDIGKNTATRLLASDMNVIAYDPNINDISVSGVQSAVWPQRLAEADFIVITCALTKSSFHMINDGILQQTKKGVRIVNVGRGPIIDEPALEQSLKDNQVYAAALDVFEVEPLPKNSYLRTHPRCIFGSHNASNTVDSVKKTSIIAINKLFNFLNI